MKHVLAFIIIASMLVSGCAAATGPLDGQVYALQLGSTMWGIKSAIEGRAGTMVMMKDNMIMFMWTLENGWAFAVVDANKQKAVTDLAKIGGGNYVNTKTMTDLVDTLRKSGWEIATGSQIPNVIKVAAATSGSWLSGLANSMTSFFVFPLGWLEPDQLEYYQNIQSLDLEGLDIGT